MANPAALTPLQRRAGTVRLCIMRSGQAAVQTLGKMRLPNLGRSCTTRMSPAIKSAHHHGRSPAAARAVEASTADVSIDAVSKANFHPPAELAVADRPHPTPDGPIPDPGSVWTDTWWPIMPVDYLDPAKPNAATVMGINLVLWRDGGGSWQVWRDACPHRCAPLSGEQGRGPLPLLPLRPLTEAFATHPCNKCYTEPFSPHEAGGCWQRARQLGTASLQPAACGSRTHPALSPVPDPSL